MGLVGMVRDRVRLWGKGPQKDSSTQECVWWRCASPVSVGLVLVTFFMLHSYFTCTFFSHFKLLYIDRIIIMDFIYHALSICGQFSRQSSKIKEMR